MRLHLRAIHLSPFQGRGLKDANFLTLFDGVRQYQNRCSTASRGPRIAGQFYRYPFQMIIKDTAHSPNMRLETREKHKSEMGN